MEMAERNRERGSIAHVLLVDQLKEEEEVFTPAESLAMNLNIDFRSRRKITVLSTLVLLQCRNTTTPKQTKRSVDQSCVNVICVHQMNFIACSHLSHTISQRCVMIFFLKRTSVRIASVLFSRTALDGDVDACLLGRISSFRISSVLIPISRHFAKRQAVQLCRVQRFTSHC